jgi:uncharacterized membrane protein YfcA
MATTTSRTTTPARTSTATRVGAGLIALTGLIHVVTAPEQLEEKAYVGVLFILAAIGSAYVAYQLWRADDRAAWGLGALIAACCFVGFILSRTTGLPGFKEEEWEALGVLSLVVEAGFIGLALTRLRR